MARNTILILAIVALLIVGCGRGSPTTRTLAQAGFSRANVTGATIVSTSDVAGAEARQASPVQIAALWQCLAVAEPVEGHFIMIAPKYRITLQTNAATTGAVVSILVDKDGGACLEGGPLPGRHFFRSTALYDWVVESHR